MLLWHPPGGNKLNKNTMYQNIFRCRLVLSRCWNPHCLHHLCFNKYSAYIDGILPKGPYPPCLRMADRAFLAGYPRYGKCSADNIMPILIDISVIDQAVHWFYLLFATYMYILYTVKQYAFCLAQIKCSWYFKTNELRTKLHLLYNIPQARMQNQISRLMMAYNFIRWGDM